MQTGGAEDGRKEIVIGEVRRFFGDLNDIVQLRSQHRLRHLLHRLPHSQIHQHLLSPTQNLIKRNRPMILLHQLPHPPLRQPPPSKDIHRHDRNLARTLRTKRFQQPNRPTQNIRLLFITHLTHLIRDALKPGLHCFGQGDHAGELGADDGEGGDWLAGDDALGGELQTFGGDCAGPAGAHGCHAPAFVVEIGEDYFDSLVFASEDVGVGDVDVFELDVCCAGRAGKVG